MHRIQRRTAVSKMIGATLLATVLATPVMAGPASATANPNHMGARWVMGGHDLANTHWNPHERRLTTATVARLTNAWTFTTSGDVSATPAVVDGAIYFPDWGGTFWKLDAVTGAVIWSHKVSDYVGIDAAVSRSSPAVVGDTVYIGTQQGASLLAIATDTGTLRWKTQIDTHPAAVLTQSPVVFDGLVYQGVSSQEEIFAMDPNYTCCTFRGSLAAVDARTGRIRWQTPTIAAQTPPADHPTDIFSGGSVWGGMPTVNPATGTVYVTTGNNYQIPASAKQCQQAGGTAAQCLPAWNRVNSIIGFDLRTGAVKWSTGQDRWDVWNGGCLPSGPPNNCPPSPGPDFDFADGSHLFVLPGPHGRPRMAVGAGQKSGEYWMLDATTGAVIWSAALGPGSFVGGIQYGSANDGRRIYFVETNGDRKPYTLPDGRTIDYSSFGALDAATGRVLWQIPEPMGNVAASALSTAGGVVYAVSVTGRMYALDAATGAVLWQFQGQATSIAAPAIVNGTVYWGNGYVRLGDFGGVAGNSFYAFRVPAAG